MEIKKNTPINPPSFGMAFVKPNEEGLNKLTEYLTRKADIRDVSAGLRRLMCDQADNKHFDIEYLSAKNSFKVLPVSDEAKQLVNGQVKLFDATLSQESNIQRLYTDLKTPVSILSQNGMSKFEIFSFKLNTLRKMFAENCKVILNPQCSLPKNLQDAAAYADEMAEKIHYTEYNRKMIKDLFKD